MADFRYVNDWSFETELVKIIQENYDQVKNRDDKFYVGLSGGSMPELLLKCFMGLVNIDWSKWLFFFCDERLVPEESQESTFGSYKRLLQQTYTRLPIDLNQFITVDTSLKGEDAALDYENRMRNMFSRSTPRFHILFLGLGPDGHTCSLFPHHRLLNEQHQLVAYIDDSPKPPPKRVTFTLPVMTQARVCLFIVSGKSKASVVKELIEYNSPLPANLVAPQAGKLIWLIDESASSMLRPELLD